MLACERVGPLVEGRLESELCWPSMVQESKQNKKLERRNKKKKMMTTKTKKLKEMKEMKKAKKKETMCSSRFHIDNRYRHLYFFLSYHRYCIPKNKNKIPPSPVGLGPTSLLGAVISHLC